MPYKEKYFYTVLFLDNYYGSQNSSTNFQVVEKPVLKTFDVKKDSNTSIIHWTNDSTLHVMHHMKMPLTLEMWNADNKPIFYCPLLKEGIDSISVGQIVNVEKFSFDLIFNDNVRPPEEGETFKLSIKTLPDFDTTSERIESSAQRTSEALDRMINADKHGLAIIFRRNSMDAHFDLECDFDDQYLHSVDKSNDMQYLSRLSKFNSVKWLTKYTENVDDVIQEINTNAYDIKFSWKENGAQWWNHS